jgi:hypothetical protein
MTMLELTRLFAEVRQRFYQTPIRRYREAMHEIGEMAEALGYTMNDLARIATYAG